MKIDRILIAILILSVFAVGTLNLTDTVNAAVKIDHENKDYIIESKEKVARYKITWNANGGTIGTRKTIDSTVTRGKNIGKLPKTPKRVGYNFKGWYTKKTGGVKIGANTKPTKKMTYYAQWNKKQTASEKRLVGTWERKQGHSSHSYSFSKEGTYVSLNLQVSTSGWGPVRFTRHSYMGSWSATGNNLHLTNRLYRLNNGGWNSRESTSMKIKFGSDEKGQYFLNENNLKFYKK